MLVEQPCKVPHRMLLEEEGGAMQTIRIYPEEDTPSSLAEIFFEGSHMQETPWAQTKSKCFDSISNIATDVSEQRETAGKIMRQVLVNSAQEVKQTPKKVQKIGMASMRSCSLGGEVSLHGQKCSSSRSSSARNKENSSRRITHSRPLKKPEVRSVRYVLSSPCRV